MSATSTNGARPEALLRVTDLVKQFPVRGGLLSKPAVVHAIDGVSLSLAPGETLAIVGESGCGKSTLARCVLRLLPSTSGRIEFAGEDITTLPAKRLRAVRKEAAMVFQDPYGSLNPRMRVGSIVGEPLVTHGSGGGEEVERRVRELLEMVGLNREHYNRFPHEFSGGQRQRIGIARALALNPRLVVCDEPVSALDLSAQAQILNLLADLRDERDLAYLFITHNLDIVQRFCDRVIVMYLGAVVESAPVGELFASPRHPYTGALLSATPVPVPRLARKRQRIPLKGDPPSPLDPPSGCRFHPRCVHAQERCRLEAPAGVSAGPGHRVACHFPLPAKAAA